MSLLLIHPLPALSKVPSSSSSPEQIEAPVEETVEPPIEETELEGDETSVDPDSIHEDTNPLNPAGDSLDRLIELRLNGDMWTAMMGELPCLEATESCLTQLQGLAIGNSVALKRSMNEWNW